LDECFILNVLWQGRRKTVYINFDGIPPFRFYKYLMSFPFSKPVNFVFNGRTISGSQPFYPSGKHWGFLKPFFQGFVNGRICIGDPATTLFGRSLYIGKGKLSRIFISPL